MSTPIQGYRIGCQSALNTIEIYLDYTCPFCAKCFPTLLELSKSLQEPLSPLKDQFTFLIRQQVQPWHPQTIPIHEAAIAISKLSPKSFIPFSALIFQHQKEFFDDMTWNTSRQDIYQKLIPFATQVGVNEDEFMDLLKYKSENPSEHNAGNAVTNDLKIQIRIARQNGIHVSPSFVVNGLLNPSISSSWSVLDWTSYLSGLV